MFLLEEQPPLLTLFTWQICKWLFWIVINLFHGITYNLRNHYRSRITKKQKFIFISLNLEKRTQYKIDKMGVWHSFEFVIKFIVNHYLIVSLPKPAFLFYIMALISKNKTIVCKEFTRKYNCSSYNVCCAGVDFANKLVEGI